MNCLFRHSILLYFLKNKFVIYIYINNKLKKINGMEETEWNHFLDKLPSIYERYKRKSKHGTYKKLFLIFKDIKKI